MTRENDMTTPASLDIYKPEAGAPARLRARAQLTATG